MFVEKNPCSGDVPLLESGMSLCILHKRHGTNGLAIIDCIDDGVTAYTYIGNLLPGMVRFACALVNLAALGFNLTTARDWTLTWPQKDDWTIQREREGLVCVVWITGTHNFSMSVVYSQRTVSIQSPVQSAYSQYTVTRTVTRTVIRAIARTVSAQSPVQSPVQSSAQSLYSHPHSQRTVTRTVSIQSPIQSSVRSPIQSHVQPAHSQHIVSIQSPVQSVYSQHTHSIQSAYNQLTVSIVTVTELSRHSMCICL